LELDLLTLLVLVASDGTAHWCQTNVLRAPAMRSRPASHATILADPGDPLRPVSS